MADKLTGKQRVEMAMRHRCPDRTPLFEYVLLSPVADRVLGRPFRSYDELPEDWLLYAREVGYKAALMRYARERVEIALRLRHDLLYVCPAPNPQPAPEGPPGGGLSEPLDGEPEDRVAARNDQAREALAHAQPDEPYLVYPFIMEAMRERGVELELFAPAYTLGIWTDADLMMTMLSEPDIARDHFALAADKAIQIIDKLSGLGVGMIGIGGDFAGNRLLISPESYRRFIVPEVRRVADAVHGAGCWAVTASDGNLWPVIDDFLIGSGADAYMEIDGRAGMDLARLKREYGSRVCLMGNIDCGELLSFGSPEQVRQATFQCLRDGWGDGGHIFTPSNAISASVSYENYKAMSDAYHDYFGLAPVEWKREA